jgi:hypothetical protein
MICESCGAIITEEDAMVTVSHGAKIDKIKFYNRACQYAIRRGKTCRNNCRVSDENLTWSAELDKLSQLESAVPETIQQIVRGDRMNK